MKKKPPKKLNPIEKVLDKLTGGSERGDARERFDELLRRASKPKK